MCSGSLSAYDVSSAKCCEYHLKTQRNVTVLATQRKVTVLATQRKVTVLAPMSVFLVI
jgi:hypothetical protein